MLLQIEQLIDEIRLAHVRDTKVGSLASGEKKRLNLVCQVALDTGLSSTSAILLGLLTTRPFFTVNELQLI